MIKGNALVILLTNPVITTDLDEEDTSISTPMLDTSLEAIQSQYWHDNSTARKHPSGLTWHVEAPVRANMSIVALLYESSDKVVLD